MAIPGMPLVVDQQTWQRELDALRVREKAADRDSSSTATCGLPDRNGSAPPARGSLHSSPGWSSWTTTTRASSSSPRGPIDQAVAYKRRVGNQMTWYSTANSPFGADVGAPPGGGFAVNVILRQDNRVYRTWPTDGRGTEQLNHMFGLIDIRPFGRQEEWQDSPESWPQYASCSRRAGSPDIARAYGSATADPANSHCTDPIAGGSR